MKRDSVGPIYQEIPVKSHLKLNYEDFHPKSTGRWRENPVLA